MSNDWQDAVFELDDLVRETKLELQTFHEKGNKSAGTRARKTAQELKAKLQDLRKEILEFKKD